MSSAYQTKQLATPTFIVDGVVIPIVPGTCTVRVPGDAKVRAMSAGGGATQAVAGLDAASLVGHVKVEIPNTAQNADRVRGWKAGLISGVGQAIIIADPEIQFPHENMKMTKDTELQFKADGNISCEWEGDYVP